MAPELGSYRQEADQHHPLSDPSRRPEQATRLDEMGCELGQGFHYARPLEAAVAQELLEPTPPAAA
jgi:hypothetical protein